MKTKAKSVHVFEVRLWSRKHHAEKMGMPLTKRKDKINIYDGFITDVKTKKKLFVDSAGDFLKAIEKMYYGNEK